MMKFSTGSFVAGVMLGALLAGAWFLSGHSSFAPTQFSSSSSFIATSTDTTTQKSSALSVADQPSGDAVTIESVTVPPPGVWVAVREVNGNTLGNVLGAARVAGPHSNISISLLRSTEPNRSYAVELYRDDNNGVFDPSTDSVYVDFNTGAPVIVYFSTTN
jgi:hypothetical protein